MSEKSQPASKRPTGTDETNVAQKSPPNADDIPRLLADRLARSGAIVYICEKGLKRYIPQAVATLDQLTEEEALEVTPYLGALGAEAVGPLVRLLKSCREEMEPFVLAALGQTGDSRAIGPLLQYMGDHAGEPSAKKARDALISLGRLAVPGLIKTLKSSNPRIRYYAVQALAWVGNDAAIDRLTELRDKDKNARIREAAEEALHFIPCTEFDECYQVYQGFWHPWLLPDTDFGAEWRVDVINIQKGAILWRFELGAPAALAGPKGYEAPCLKAVLQSYLELAERTQDLDLLILSGELLDDDEKPEFFGLAVAGISTTLEVEQTNRLFLGGINARLRHIPGYKTPVNYWLGRADLQPRYHMEHGTIIEYDRSTAKIPPARRRDATGLFFTPAKAVLDTAWVYRVNLKKYQEGGDFPHIPLQEKDPLRE